MAAVYNFIWSIINPLRLTGPIFDKELRVSSRRRRNYVLRFAYLVLLTAYLALIWIALMGQSGTAVYRISRMAEAGKYVIACLVWFQFCATQILAGIMLSNAISDEIYHKTLGLLMTTPISSLQIVIGKLSSKLLQLVLLMAISLPLLAIVRVMGGVPWNYVISSLCITLTTVIFVGSLSLFFSIFSRRAYVVIIITVLTIGFFFALLPLLSVMSWHSLELRSIVPEKILLTVLISPNPYCTMFFHTIMMLEPRAAAGMPASLWPLNCGIMLAVSVVLLLVSMVMVRKVALRQATGQLGIFAGSRRLRKKLARATTGRQNTTATRSIIGPPVLWKELRFPMLGRRKVAVYIAIAVSLILLLVTYVLIGIEGELHEEEVHMLYAIIFLAIGTLFTIVLSSTCISSEKESRSWPLLMTTTLNDRDILFGKFVGVLRRCFPAWLLLFGHIIIFTVKGYIHPIAILQIGVLVFWVVVFLSGTGLYFSSRFKHTTTAVIMNFALAATIWAILPLLMAIVGSINTPFKYEVRVLVEAYMDTNPFVHAIVIMEATARNGRLRSYDWIRSGSLSLSRSTIWMLSCMVGYILISLLFAWRAKCQFRRKIF